MLSIALLALYRAPKRKRISRAMATAPATELRASAKRSHATAGALADCLCLADRLPVVRGDGGRSTREAIASEALEQLPLDTRHQRRPSIRLHAVRLPVAELSRLAVLACH